MYCTVVSLIENVDHKHKHTHTHTQTQTHTVHTHTHRGERDTPENKNFGLSTKLNSLLLLLSHNIRSTSCALIEDCTNL